MLTLFILKNRYHVFHWIKNMEFFQKSVTPFYLPSNTVKMFCSINSANKWYMYVHIKHTAALFLEK